MVSHRAVIDGNRNTIDYDSEVMVEVVRSR